MVVSFSDSRLMLVFGNKNPLTASALGELFTAMAKDYAKVNKGRVLVVTNLETGSLIAVLQDLAAAVGSIKGIAEATDAICNYMLKIRTLITQAREDPEKANLFKGKRGLGIKSAEALFKIAADNDCEIEVSLGSELKIKMTPAEAIRIREEGATERDRLENVRQAQLRIPFRPDAKGALSEDNLASNLSHELIGYNRLSGDKTAETEATIAAIVSVLSSHGSAYLIEEVASNLDSYGYYELAARIRKRAKPSDRDFEPPLRS